jgi:hypothetical protein
MIQKWAAWYMNEVKLWLAICPPKPMLSTHLEQVPPEHFTTPLLYFKITHTQHGQQARYKFPVTQLQCYPCLVFV